MANLVKVDFHGDVVEAEKDGDVVWVGIRRVCDNLGLAHQPQFKKLQSKAWATVTLRVTVADDGKTREVACIPLKAVPLWLATVDVRNVKEGIRAKLEKYQKECADVLAAHFFGAPKPAVVPTAPAAPAPSDDPLIQQMYAVIQLRQNQLATEKRLAEVDRKATEALEAARSSDGFLTVLGWARNNGRRMTLKEAARHGRFLSNHCGENGINMGKMHDPRWGTVNSYPIGILNAYFRKVYSAAE